MQTNLKQKWQNIILIVHLSNSLFYFLMHLFTLLFNKDKANIIFSCNVSFSVWDNLSILYICYLQTDMYV